MSEQTAQPPLFETNQSGSVGFVTEKNLPLDALITHPLAVNVFTTVDPLLGFLQQLSSFFSQSSMESRQQWLTRLKNAFSNSPLVSNVVFGFILTGLEKLVELEFECPCKPIENDAFSSAFFIIPAVTAFILMLIIQGCRCDRWTTVYSSVPAVVWLILMFFDGQYFVCAMTYWEGRYVQLDKAAAQKWCEPISEGNVNSQQRMLYSQRLFFISQCIGIGILFIFICAGFGVYVYRKKHPQEVERQDADDNELTVFRTG